MLEEMALFFENRLAGYDEHMRTTIAGAEEFYKFTAEQLPTAERCAILDLGCGTGLELEAYFAVNPSACITGIDLTQGMLSALQRKFPNHSLDLICGSYFDVSFGVDRFHAAVSVESLHHFTAEKKRALYEKLFHALKADGYFILTDYFAETDAQEREYFANLQKLKKEQGLHEDQFFHYDTPLTAAHEMEALKTAGFSDVRILRSWDTTCTLKAVK